MFAEYIIKGMLIGLIFGVPAGAIGALTIQRTLERGFKMGLLTGLGSSAADIIYACVGIFGIRFIMEFLSEYQFIIRILGGSFITIFGICILRKKPQDAGGQDENEAPLFCFLSSFLAALLNPVAVLSFLAAFTAFEIEGNLSVWQGMGLILGMLAGTLCWWLLLSGMTAYFRHRVTGRIYQWLNRILGCFMLIFGAVMLIRH